MKNEIKKALKETLKRINIEEFISLDDIIKAIEEKSNEDMMLLKNHKFEIVKQLVGPEEVFINITTFNIDNKFIETVNVLNEELETLSNLISILKNLTE